jgi:hypothetical protein
MTMDGRQSRGKSVMGGYNYNSFNRQYNPGFSQYNPDGLPRKRPQIIVMGPPPQYSQSTSGGSGFSWKRLATWGGIACAVGAILMLIRGGRKPSTSALSEIAQKLKPQKQTGTVLGNKVKTEIGQETGESLLRRSGSIDQPAKQTVEEMVQTELSLISNAPSRQLGTDLQQTLPHNTTGQVMEQTGTSLGSQRDLLTTGDDSVKELLSQGGDPSGLSRGGVGGSDLSSLQVRPEVPSLLQPIETQTDTRLGQSLQALQDDLESSILPKSGGHIQPPEQTVGEIVDNLEAPGKTIVSDVQESLTHNGSILSSPNLVDDSPSSQVIKKVVGESTMQPVIHTDSQSIQSHLPLIDEGSELQHSLRSITTQQGKGRALEETSQYAELDDLFRQQTERRISTGDKQRLEQLLNNDQYQKYGEMLQDKRHLDRIQAIRNQGFSLDQAPEHLQELWRPYKKVGLLEERLWADELESLQALSENPKFKSEWTEEMATRMSELKSKLEPHYQKIKQKWFCDNDQQRELYKDLTNLLGK